MRPTERVIERLRISPNVRNENFLTSLAKIFFDSLHKASSDTLTANANVDDEFAKVCPESQVMGAREADNLRPLFPHEGQPIRGTYRFGNGVFGPPWLPESWHHLHQGSNVWNV